MTYRVTSKIFLNIMATKYSKKTQRKIKKIMHEYKAGKLKSGKSAKKVKSRKQAIAIGISEARKKGTKVPKQKKKAKSK
jgi:hypothetical protein